MMSPFMGETVPARLCLHGGQRILFGGIIVERPKRQAGRGGHRLHREKSLSDLGVVDATRSAASHPVSHPLNGQRAHGFFLAQALGPTVSTHFSGEVFPKKFALGLRGGNLPNRGAILGIDVLFQGGPVEKLGHLNTEICPSKEPCRGDTDRG